MRQIKYFVTPAKAGAHHQPCKFHRQVMDSRLRGNDGSLNLHFKFESQQPLDHKMPEFRAMPHRHFQPFGTNLYRAG